MEETITSKVVVNSATSFQFPDDYHDYNEQQKTAKLPNKNEPSSTKRTSHDSSNSSSSPDDSSDCFSSDNTTTTALSITAKSQQITISSSDETTIAEAYKVTTSRHVMFHLLAVLSVGLLYLLVYWKPEWKVYLQCTQTKLQHATHLVMKGEDSPVQVCVVHEEQVPEDFPEQYRTSQAEEEEEVEEDQDDECSLLPQNSRHSREWKYRHFTYQLVKFAWVAAEQRFMELSALESGTALTELLTRYQGYSTHQRDLRQQLYGPNKISVPVRPYLSLLFTEVLNPFYVFQVGSIVLWCMDDYYLYAGCIFFMSCLSIGLALHQTRQQSERLHAMVETAQDVTAEVLIQHQPGRPATPVVVPVASLVPGDVVLLPAAAGCLLPCDLVLIAGTAIVNESMLTGESVPVTKTAVTVGMDGAGRQRRRQGQGQGQDQEEVEVEVEEYEPERHKRHTLFCGTQLIQTRYYGNAQVLAVVVRTGLRTAKGELVRSIMFPRPLLFSFYRDSVKFICGLFLLASVGMAYTIALYIQRGESVATMIIRSLDLVTIVVPPALPAAMTVGTYYAHRRLRRRRLFCVSPPRINVAGKIKLMCFDKTGTLTEDCLEVFGVVGVDLPASTTDNTTACKNIRDRLCGRPTLWSSVRPVSSLAHHSDLMAVLASCHDLTYVHGNLIGDPLDIKMFRATNWELDEPAETSYKSLMLTVLRPPPSAPLHPRTTTHAPPPSLPPPLTVATTTHTVTATVPAASLTVQSPLPPQLTVTPLTTHSPPSPPPLTVTPTAMGAPLITHSPLPPPLNASSPTASPTTPSLLPTFTTSLTSTLLSQTSPLSSQTSQSLTNTSVLSSQTSPLSSSLPVTSLSSKTLSLSPTSSDTKLRFPSSAKFSSFTNQMTNFPQYDVIKQTYPPHPITFICSETPTIKRSGTSTLDSSLAFKIVSDNPQKCVHLKECGSRTSSNGFSGPNSRNNDSSGLNVEVSCTKVMALRRSAIREAQAADAVTKLPKTGVHVCGSCETVPKIHEKLRSCALDICDVVLEAVIDTGDGDNGSDGYSNGGGGGGGCDSGDGDYGYGGCSVGVVGCDSGTGCSDDGSCRDNGGGSASGRSGTNGIGGSSGASGSGGASGTDGSGGKTTKSSQIQCASSTQVDDREPPLEVGLVRVFGFSSAVQRLSVVVRRLGRPHMEVYCKGAPEVIVGLCDPATVPEDLEATLEGYTVQGLRVLALACRDLPRTTTWHTIQRCSRDKVEHSLRLLGLLVLQNPLKPASAAVIRQLRAANIRTVMATGDNVMTGVSVARECGMVGADERVVVLSVTPPSSGTCPTPAMLTATLAGLPALDTIMKSSSNNINGNNNNNNSNGVTTSITDNSNDNRNNSNNNSNNSRNNSDNNNGSNNSNNSSDAYQLALSGTTWTLLQQHFPHFVSWVCCKGVVFGRMHPDHKSELVQQLMEQDYVVGMCGDGANDCGALKTAHVGLSLSEAEASVAAPFTSSVADVSCVPLLLQEGRAALTTNFSVFKYMALYSVIQFVTVLLLYTAHSNLSDPQFLYIDLGIVTSMALFMGYTGPSNQLVAARPLSRLLGGLTLFSVAGQVVLVTAGQLAAYMYLRSQPWFTPNTGDGGDAGAGAVTWEGTTLFCVSSLQYLALAVVYSPGAPFRRPLYTNFWLLGSLVVLSVVSTAFVLLPGPWTSVMYLASEVTDGVPVHWLFRTTLFLMALVHLLAAWMLERFTYSSSALKRFLQFVGCKRQPKNRYKRVLEAMAHDPTFPPLHSPIIARSFS